jgi:hypothetical protein
MNRMQKNQLVSYLFLSKPLSNITNFVTKSQNDHKPSTLCHQHTLDDTNRHLDTCRAKCIQVSPKKKDESITPLFIVIYTGCPRTGSPEKKGSLRANILTCILNKKSPISNDNREKTF